MTSASNAPRLAVHVGRHVPEGLAAVLAAAVPWAEVVAAPSQEPLPDGVRAHVYTDDVLPDLPSRPCVVWRRAGSTPGTDPDVDELGDVGSPAPGPGWLPVCLLPWPDRARPLLPFTRSRYRLLRELPDTMLAVGTDSGLRWGAGGETPRPAPDSAWPTLAALSSAVVARGDLAWAALAWAAPTVTDEETARRLSLTPDEHVLVTDDPAEAARLALDLAGDQARAAGLARRGWSAARDRRPDRVAEAMCRRLGLERRDLTPTSRLTVALDELGTPPDSLVRRRAREATAVLPGAPIPGGRPAERSSREQS